MKKLLLSLGLLAGVMTANATVYTIFEAPAKNAWEEVGDDFSTSVTVDGQNFTLDYVKNSSTTKLRNPGTEDYSWRVYKNSEVDITSYGIIMKGIRFTIDGSNYAKEGTPGAGWTGTLDEKALTYTFNNANGSMIFDFTADQAQIRIKKIEVSDEAFAVEETPDVPVTPATVVNSIKETLALASGTVVTVNYQTIVAFVNNKNCFVQDEAGDFIQIYNNNSYEVNDIIPAGWTATYELYNNVTPELTNAKLPESTEKGDFKPAVVAAADITTDLVNSVIAVKDVVFDEDTPSTKTNFSGVSDDTTLSLRNQYELDSVEAGTYNVTLLVINYNNAVSLYVINYDADIINTAVEAIEVENGEAQYYTLTGVKVTNPENGIYIRVLNGKADKVAL